MLLLKYKVAITLLLSVSFVDSCQPPPCHWSNDKPVKDHFEGLANALIAADRRAQQICYNYGGRSSKEIFGNMFRYVIPVERYHSNDFTVRIMNRLLFIHGNSCEKIFAEVRLIPDFLNVYQATWAYQNEEIVVSIPYLYNRRVGMVTKLCQPHDSTLIIVTKEENPELYGSSV